MYLFDITSKDISQLNDEDLRTLIGLLCEAEVSKAGLPVNGISWGGDQNATDGGQDVTIKIKRAPKNSDFVPNKNTIYQVKKSNITPTGLDKEMRPKNNLRVAIKSLIKLKGCYIIVSAATVSEKNIELRRKAMRKAVSRHQGSKDLTVDFLDASKVATWARCHPSVLIWLRERINKELKGWQRFGDWTGSPSLSGEYILDDQVRIRFAASSQKSELSSLEGLEEIRSYLRQEKTSLRLAGLSGVGKTRFVQALFENVGREPLNPALAIYTDISLSPVPDPESLCNQLIQRSVRAIIIVDNCTPHLHSQLTKIIGINGSHLSLLTVEYDVRDDLPEETEVFIMEPSSEKLIEVLIERRFPEVGKVNARNIASFSGGNARVALALAGTVKKGESLSELRNEELFERLFKQRNDPDQTLLEAAEVCALVYSFEGTRTDAQSEIAFLAGLASIDSASLYKHIATLKRRGLVQSRDVWRAILPHAIANRLAKKALESIPVERIRSAFEKEATERLVKSFSNRIQYLHDSSQAVSIVKDWLSPTGWLGSTKGKLNDFGIKILFNIAPVAPDSLISFFKFSATEDINFTSRSNYHFDKITRLLCLLAYEPRYFDQCMKLLCRFVKSESPNENNNPIKPRIGALFQLLLSGTLASVSQRRQIIEELLSSEDPNDHPIGVYLLSKTLQTTNFVGSEYTFGARLRDYGYRPLNRQQVFEWYSTFIGLCVEIANQDKNQKLKKEVRETLGGNIRQLWRTKFFDLLEESSKSIHAYSPWVEGWIGIKNIFFYDKSRNEELEFERLRVLEEHLRPSDLLAKARTIALTKGYALIDIGDDPSGKEDVKAQWRLMPEQAKKVGTEVAMDNHVFKSILPELLTNENQRLFSFGLGFGEGSVNLEESWMTIFSTLQNITADERRFQFVIGFLAAWEKRESTLFNAIMDSLIVDDILAPYFPYIQSALTIDIKAIDRFKESLRLGSASLHMYRNIEWGRFDQDVTDLHFIDLLQALVKKKDGISIVVDCLHARLATKQAANLTPSIELLAFGARTLAYFPFTSRTHAELDWTLGQLAEDVLKEDKQHARITCLNLLTAIRDVSYFHNYEQLVRTLANLHPSIFLDVFVSVSQEDDLDYSPDSINNPFNQIPADDIISWCENNVNRIAYILAKIHPFESTEDGNKPKWKPMVFKMLEISTDISRSLIALERWLIPWGWDRPLSQILEEHLMLLDDLLGIENEQVRQWIPDIRKRIKEGIEHELNNEQREVIRMNETFED